MPSVAATPHANYETARDAAWKMLNPEPHDPYSIVYAIGGLIVAGLAIVDAVDRVANTLDERRIG